MRIVKSGWIPPDDRALKTGYTISVPKRKTLGQGTDESWREKALAHRKGDVDFKKQSQRLRENLRRRYQQEVLGRGSPRIPRSNTSTNH
jgi:hypothetical protein